MCVRITLCQSYSTAIMLPRFFNEVIYRHIFETQAGLCLSAGFRGRLNMRDIQASLVIRDLTLRVFAITRFRGGKKKPWENCTVILQSPCTVVAWLCGARTSWSHLTSISVRRIVELASPVDVECSSYIFKAMEKRSRPNCDKNGCKCKKQRKAVTLDKKLSVIHFTRFRVTRWFLGTN